MKFEIGNPEHGWVNIKLSHSETEIEFEASDVPNNPISELIRAIESALNGIDSLVWWNLEPAGYYFKFTILGSELELEVLYSINSTESQAQTILVVHGSCHELLVVFWRALRKLETFNLKEPNWPAVEFKSLDPIELGLNKLKAG